MNWEIYSYGNGDFLRMVFNGIASIFGNADYLGALQTSALIGFVVILVGVAFQKGQIDIKWMLGIIMIVSVLMVPKEDVIIVDRVVPANTAVVSNIPLGLAASAGMFSFFGDWVTRAFETVFSLPNEVKYTGNGLLFANTLVEESTRFQMTNARVSANFTEFWKSCVYYDLLLGLYGWQDVVESTSLMSFFKNNTSQTRSFTYEDSSNSRIIIGCRTGANGVLDADLDAEIERSSNIQGVRLVSNESTQTIAVARFASSLPVAYSYLTGLSLSNSQILSQNVMANSLKRGLSNFASDADASAAGQDFALARAEAERKNTFNVMGKLSQKMLPILQGLFEAFIYAVFPLVMILAMLPVGAKVLLGYVKMLFWINMWPPLYAILHFAMSYYGQKAASAAVVQGGGGFPTGLSIMTNTGLGAVVSDYAAFAGYMSISIPMIAWMMVSQSGAMMAGLAGRVMQSYDSTVASASNEASAGNINVGNMKYETESSFQRNASVSDSRGGIMSSDGIGNNTKISAAGDITTDVASSTLPMNVDYGSATTSSAKSSLSDATSIEEAQGAKVTESNAALRAEVDSATDRINKGQSTGTNYSSGEKQSLSQAQENTERVVEQWAERNGVSFANAKAISAEMSAQISTGGSIGFADIKAGAAARAGVEERQITQEDYTKVSEMMQSEQYSQALRAEGAAARDISARFEMGTSDSSENGLQAALNNQIQASDDYGVAQKGVEQAAKQLEYAETVSASIQAKGNDGFMNWLSEEKGLSQNDIKTLVTDANHGDTDAMRYRDQYTNEYVASELSKYSSSNISSEGLNSPQFKEIDQEQEAMKGRGGSAIATVAAAGGAGVAGAAATNVSEVDNFGNERDKDLVEEGIDRSQETIMDNMESPGNVIMNPLNMSPPSKAQEIKDDVAEGQDKGFVENSIDKAKESVKSLFE